MKNNYQEKIYNPNLKDGHEYQDFIHDELYKIGLPVYSYNSKKYQIEKGENKLGIEIKFDKKYQKTGNLWIELSEKSNPKNTQYVESGINRNDNSWLYIIGNYEEIFIFSKKLLKQLAETGRYSVLENAYGTSKGFLLPKEDAEKYCAKKLTVHGSQRE